MFLLNNYKQALDILDDGPHALEQAMLDLTISDEKVFKDWLEEEKGYLQGLRAELQEETLPMEYWQKLVNLQGSEYIVFTNKSVIIQYLIIQYLNALQEGPRSCKQSLGKLHTG